MVPIVFLDTETTGIHRAREVWEVGMIRRDDDGECETQFFVDINLRDADPFGLAVGRFYERHPTGAILSGGKLSGNAPLKTPRDAAMTVARWTHGAHIIGAVPSFDTNSLADLLHEHGLTPGWHYHLIDIESMVVGYIRALQRWGPKLEDAGVDVDTDEEWQRIFEYDATPPWKYQELQDVLGLKPQPEEDVHTALGDARRVAEIWDMVQ